MADGRWPMANPNGMLQIKMSAIDQRPSAPGYRFFTISAILPTFNLHYSIEPVYIEN
jgi:hypothetical protein